MDEGARLEIAWAKAPGVRIPPSPLEKRDEIENKRIPLFHNLFSNFWIWIWFTPGAKKE